MCWYFDSIQYEMLLTHLPLVSYICAMNRFSIGSDNGLLPVWRQAII